MAKKLEANGLFESSRMIIPEHREAYLQYMEHKTLRPKPVIDNQEWQLIGQALLESLQQHAKVTITLYDPYEDKQASGFVTVVNTFRKEIKLRHGDNWEWIKFDDILSAQT
ncbi:YolD-like family protein [Paenibacillus sp.]|uniref:YolD-like family protein n=1 Tax=Paenibacillus sp. TaxID=58172 RepID=UPI002824C67E|nr:YolD-like family protein [Paenibacillus sp.]MDR0271012.1 YolD-like family protein [Paenibacillus sp.]